MSDNYYYKKYRKYKDLYKMVAGSATDHQPEMYSEVQRKYQTLRDNVKIKYSLVAPARVDYIAAANIPRTNETSRESLKLIKRDGRYTDILQSIFKIMENTEPGQIARINLHSLDSTGGYTYMGKQDENSNVTYFDTLTDFYCEYYEHILSFYNGKNTTKAKTQLYDDNKDWAKTVLQLLVYSYTDAYYRNRHDDPTLPLYNNLKTQIDSFNTQTSCLAWITSFLQFFQIVQYVKVLEWAGSSDSSICIRDKNGKKYKFTTLSNDPNIKKSWWGECSSGKHCKVMTDQGYERAQDYLKTKIEYLKNFPNDHLDLDYRSRLPSDIIKYGDVYLVKGQCS